MPRVQALLREPADVLRAALLVGALLMSALGEFDESVRLLGTFLVLVVARLLNPPQLFDLLFAIGMSLQGWGNALDLFDLWGWYNKVVHFALPLGSAPVLYIVLARLDVVHDLHERCHQRLAAGVVIIATALVSTVGALYEVWELFIHHVLDAPIDVGYTDTVTDLLDNSLGGLVGGLLLAWWGTRGGGTSRRAPAVPEAG